VYQADAGMEVRVRLGLGNMRCSAPQLCMAITGPVIVGQPDYRGCVTLDVDRADLTMQRLIEDATEPLECDLATYGPSYREMVGRKSYRQDFPCPASMTNESLAQSFRRLSHDNLPLFFYLYISIKLFQIFSFSNVGSLKREKTLPGIGTCIVQNSALLVILLPYIVSALSRLYFRT
jgi:hypothetical protein